MTAWCPAGATASEYQAGPEMAASRLPTTGLLVGEPVTLGAIRVNWRTADEGVLDALQDALLADGTRTELLAYLHTQQPDEALIIDEVATRAGAEAWGRVPHTYVRVTDDRAMPLALQDRFIAEADALVPDNPFDVRSIGGSHLGFQLRPAPLVEVLEDLAR